MIFSAAFLPQGGAHHDHPSYLALVCPCLLRSWAYPRPHPFSPPVASRSYNSGLPRPAVWAVILVSEAILALAAVLHTLISFSDGFHTAKNSVRITTMKASGL